LSSTGLVVEITLNIPSLANDISTDSTTIALSMNNMGIVNYISTDSTTVVLNVPRIQGMIPTARSIQLNTSMNIWDTYEMIAIPPRIIEFNSSVNIEDTYEIIAIPPRIIEFNSSIGLTDTYSLITAQAPSIDQGISSLADALASILNATANWIKDNASVLVGIALGITVYYLIYTRAMRIRLIRMLFTRLR